MEPVAGFEVRIAARAFLRAEGQPMNDTTALDQADEDILTYDLSDEALEAAAGTERGRGFSCGVIGSHCGGPTQIC
jgi:hypothetical protein